MSVLLWLTRSGLAFIPAPHLVVFGRAGLCVASIYLAALYSLTYPFIRPEGLPSRSIQLLTLIFYAMAGIGLWVYQRRTPIEAPAGVTIDERRRLVGGLLAIFGLGSVASFVSGAPALMLPIVANFALWTPLGFALTGLALAGPVLRRN